MPRLTYDTLQYAESRINALKDRELILRSLQLPRIENLALTRDLHDTIDLSDNELRSLDSFPKMSRLKNLLCSSNRIAKIDPELYLYIPNLQVLVLNNNQIQELGDLEPLASSNQLSYLSLLDNPVTMKKHYRPYLIHKIPSLRVLDFKKIKEKERQEAEKLFSGTKGKALVKELSQVKAKTFEPGQDLPSGLMDGSVNVPADANGKKKLTTTGLTQEETAKIREAIKNAKTMDEITRLEAILKSGKLPKELK